MALFVILLLAQAVPSLLAVKDEEHDGEDISMQQHASETGTDQMNLQSKLPEELAVHQVGYGDAGEPIDPKTFGGLPMGPTLNWLAEKADSFPAADWIAYLQGGKFSRKSWALLKYSTVRDITKYPIVYVPPSELVDLMSEGHLCGGLSARGKCAEASAAGKVVVAHNLDESTDIDAWTKDEGHSGIFLEACQRYTAVFQCEKVLLAVRDSDPASKIRNRGPNSINRGDGPSLTVEDDDPTLPEIKYLGSFLLVAKEMIGRASGTMTKDSVLQLIFQSQMPAYSRLQILPPIRSLDGREALATAPAGRQPREPQRRGNIPVRNE